MHPNKKMTTARMRNPSPDGAHLVVRDPVAPLTCIRNGRVDESTCCVGCQVTGVLERENSRPVEVHELEGL